MNDLLTEKEIRDREYDDQMAEYMKNLSNGVVILSVLVPILLLGIFVVLVAK